MPDYKWVGYTTRMAKTQPPTAIRPQQIEQAIVVLRGQRVLLDSDLARLYGVATKALNQTVRRNPDRFPLILRFSLRSKRLQS